MSYLPKACQYFIQLWIFLFLVTESQSSLEPELVFPQIQCFYTSWSRYRDAWSYTPANVNPFLCTTIVYAFAQILDNRIALYDWKDEDNLRDLVAMKELNPNLRIHLSVGGWTLSYQFKPMVATVDGRHDFVNSTVELLRNLDLDGIDLDWEYPEDEDKATYTALLQDFRNAFDEDSKRKNKRRLALTLDVGALMHGGYDVPEMNRLVDLVNVMAYDFHGSWDPRILGTGHNAPLFPRASEKDYQTKLNVQYSAQMWVDAGMPKEKIAIGIPTYGRTWVLQDSSRNSLNAPVKGPGPKGQYSKESGSLSYFEICTRLNAKSLTAVTDNECRCTYAYGASDGLWVGFDDVTSFTLKAEWIKTKGYNGVLIWELGLDDFKGACGGKQSPMFSAIYEVFNGKAVPAPPPTRAPRPGDTTVTRRPLPTRQPAPIISTKQATCDDIFCSYRPTGDYSLGPCAPSFCSCVGGASYNRDCPPGVIYDPTNKVCSWTYAVPGCAALTAAVQQSNSNKLVEEKLQSCRDLGNCLCDSEFCMRHGLGDFALGLCLSDFCACAPGHAAFTKTCPSNLIFDPKLSVCNWKNSVATC